MAKFFEHRPRILIAATLLLIAGGCGGGPSQSGIIPSHAGPQAGAAGPAAIGLAPLSTTMSVTPGTPLHVQNYTFWKQSGIATSVPASWAAEWATWVETGTSTNAKAFHNAGGKYAVAYTNPNYYIVEPGYTAPGNYAPDSFGYGSNGLKTQRPQGGGTEYYLLSNSLSAQLGFQGVATQVKAGGGFDFVYADGVSDALSESLYRFSPTPAQITTTSQYVAGMKQMMTLSPLPTIINGYNNGDPLTEAQEYVPSTNVAGVFGEECFTSYTVAYTGSRWLSMANALLMTTAHHNYAICGGRGALADNRAFRLYWLASWWLTYDPVYSVSLAIFSSPGDIYVFAEQTIVPTSPTSTASDVSGLKWYTGAYVRRFDKCYYQGALWGPCAAVVNPSSTTSVRIPALPVAYHHSVALDNNNLFNGGAATLSTAVPTTLAPGTAAILVQ